MKVNGSVLLLDKITGVVKGPMFYLTEGVIKTNEFRFSTQQTTPFHDADWTKSSAEQTDEKSSDEDED